MRKALWPLFLAIALSLCIPPSFGQKFQPKSILFEGAPEFSDADMMAAAGLKRGAILTTAEMNGHAKQLMDSGAFDTLSYKFDGVDMVFSLFPATLYPVRLANLPLTPGPELDSALHARCPLYHGKVPSEGTLLDDVRKALQEMLAAEGIAAEVTATPYSEQTSRGKVTAISFSIASPPVNLGDVRFEGASSDLLPQLQAIVKSPSLLDFDTINTTANLEHNLTLFYQDRGYAAVNLHARQSGAANIQPDSIRISYLVTIQEGHTYKLGAILLPAGSLVSQAEIGELLHKIDDKLPGTHVRAVWGLLTMKYHSRGYLDFVCTPHAILDESTGTVNFKVDLVPGPVYRLALVKFENVSEDVRAQLMRAWQLMPGEPFNESYVASFIPKVQLSDPELSKSLAGVMAHSTLLEDPTTHDVNLVIRLENH